MSQLDRVHARIMLIELLRETAPPIESWGPGILDDAIGLALQLAAQLTGERARRSTQRAEGGRLEQS